MVNGIRHDAFCGSGGLNREAPGGNPGTPGVKTNPLSMPYDGMRFAALTPHRMARGLVFDAESPGFRRGLFVGVAHPKKPRA